MPGDSKLKNLSKNSTKMYERNCAFLIQWLLDNKPALITDNYKKELRRNQNEGKFIENSIFRQNVTPPIVFSDLKGEDIVAWLSSILRPNGDWFGSSVYRNHKNALKHFLYYYGLNISQYEKQIKEFFAQINNQNSMLSPSKQVETSSSKESKFEVRRMSPRTLLAEMRDFIGDGQYAKVNGYLKEYHKAMSSSNSSEQSENAIECLKSQMSSLLNGNERLYSKFLEFLPPMYRGV